MSSYYDKKKELFQALKDTIKREKSVIYDTLVYMYRERGFGEKLLDDDLQILSSIGMCGRKGAFREIIIFIGDTPNTGQTNLIT